MAAHLEQLWAQVEHAYIDPTAHDAFISACAEAERLDFAGQKYRQRQKENPDDAIARRRLEQVMASVTILMRSEGAGASAPRMSLSVSTLKVALGLAVLGVFAGCWLGEQLWPLPEDRACGGLLRGSPVCLIMDLFAALSNGAVFAAPLACGGFAVGIFLGRRFDRFD